MKARSVQVWLLFGARLFCQANRLSFGGLLPLISADLHFSVNVKGQLLSAFPLGYMMTQVIGGYASDRFGGKPVMGLALFSIGLGIFAVGYANSFNAMWTIMFCMGLLEGPSFPAGGVILARWAPASERGSANAINDAGGPVGALVALFITPTLASTYGWRAACACLGVGTMLFTAAWLAFAANDPQSCYYVSREELGELEKKGICVGSKTNVQQTKPGVGIPWRLVTFPSVWAAFVGHMGFNYCRYVLYNWMISYYIDILKVPVSEAGLCMFWPNVLDGVASLAIGRGSDALTSSGKISTCTIRRVCSTIGFLGTGVGAALIPMADGRISATIILTLASGMQGFHNAGFKCTYGDLSREHCGFLRGIGNTLGTGSSFIGPLLAVTLLERGGGPTNRSAWSDVFNSVFHFACFCAIGYAALVSNDDVDLKLRRLRDKNAPSKKAD